MKELIVNAAQELGIAQYVSISDFSNAGEHTVTVSPVAGHGVTRKLWPHDLLDIAELKRTLLEMFEEAEKIAASAQAI